MAAVATVAAAAMMAGTWDERESSPVNLRNIGFTMWMGALDSAFHRNARAVKFAGKLDSLRAADPEGYVHSLNIVPGKGHWMDNANTVAVEWMARFGREIFNGFVTRRERHIRTSIEERADPDYIFSALIEVSPEGVRAL